MIGLNPYEFLAGEALDALVHHEVLGLPLQGYHPPYLTERTEAEKVKGVIEKTFGIAVITGHTRIRGKSWFAR